MVGGPSCRTAPKPPPAPHPKLKAAATAAAIRFPTAAHRRDSACPLLHVRANYTPRRTLPCGGGNPFTRRSAQLSRRSTPVDADEAIPSQSAFTVIVLKPSGAGFSLRRASRPASGIGFHLPRSLSPMSG